MLELHWTVEYTGFAYIQYQAWTGQRVVSITDDYGNLVDMGWQGFYTYFA